MKFIENQLSSDEFLRFQSGDEHIFEEIYSRYYDVIVQKVYRLCRDMEATEDIVHEAFVQLFLNKTKLMDAAGIYPYIYVVTKRLAISHFRKQVIRTEFQEQFSLDWKEQTDECQDNIDAKDLNKMLTQVIEQLPTQQRLVYKMNKFEDKSYDEIARDIGLSKNTVRNHIASATKIVRFKLSNLLLLIFILKNLF